MADVAKSIERADKLLEKGKPEAALAELRTGVELDSDNESLLQKTADLATSIGQLGVASELLRRLFHLTVERKDLPKAAVLFRKLHRLKVLDPEVVCRYAELCENTNRRDSAEAYRIAFQEFQQRAEPRRALAAIANSLRLDARLEDYREQARIAEALHESVLAAGALVNLGVMQERLGQDAAEAYEHAHRLDKTNLAARLGYGRALIGQGQPAAAIELLQPLATYPSAPQEAREPYALALLAVGRVEEAEPFLWAIFERNPSENLPVVHTVIRELMEREHIEDALALARRLEDFFRKEGRRAKFIDDMIELAKSAKPNVLFFEYLAELFNSANREADYARMLGLLFDQYFKDGNYAKALDALDRAVDIDPYEAAHQERLARLAGRVDGERLQTVAKRLGLEASVDPGALPEAASESAAVPKVFEDLVLQAELFLQYGMREKALEKIQQIKQSFPAEVESDTRVRTLFANAGVAVPDPPASVASSDERRPVDEAVARALEVNRIIARQTDARSVLVTAANQIGGRWQYSRCVLALATPGKPPTLVVEYCAPETAKSERLAMARLLATSQRLMAQEPVFRAADVSLSAPLQPIQNDLARLDICSMVALALLAGDEHIGLLLVEQCGVRRRWSPENIEVLRSMADQISQAVQGARLRLLATTLGVAEEKTGLLKRSAYLDAVVADVKRQQEGKHLAASTLALLQVVSLTAAWESDTAVAELVRALRALVSERAMMFRYDLDTVALLLPSMNEDELRDVVEQARDALAPIGLSLTTGMALAPSSNDAEVEDVATEWVNRVHRALSLAAAVEDRFCHLPPAPRW